MEISELKQDLLKQLREHPFVAGFKPEHIDQLGLLAKEVQFAEDQVIFREGEESKYFYLLLSGRVALEIVAGHTLCLQTVGEGDELGWSSILGTLPTQFQARAVEPVRALAFEGPALLELSQGNCSFGYALMRGALGVVAERLHNSLLQLLDVYRPARKVS